MEITKILEELYALDPGLKEHEEDLIDLIKQMSDLKPDTKFDKRFAARLKKEILQKNNISKITFNFMNKKIYLVASSVAVLGLILIFVSFNRSSRFEDNWGLNNLSKIQGGQTKTDNKTAFIKLSDNAYGSLAKLSSETIGLDTKASAPMGLGGASEISTISPNVAVSSQSSRGMMTTGVAVSSPGAIGGGMPSSGVIDSGVNVKMMPPSFGYKYVYKGDALDLKETTGDVYRRIKGDGQMGKNLAGLISSQNLGPVNLNSFRDLKMTNLSLIEDRDLGLMINFDFNEDNIYISENWEKWQVLERNACTDEKCFNQFRLKIEDVPADNTLISIAKDFLNTYGVSLDNYGEPSVENNWREDYQRYPDKTNYYIPEYATVVYPLLVNKEMVRDQSGNYAGLRVTVNVTRKAASGLNGLMPYRYETSSYPLETDAEKITKAINRGGWNGGYYYMDSVETKDIELGTPFKSLVQTWKYNGVKNDEILVPALIFPVINAPADYYGSKFISVPLVKEMLVEMTGELTQPGGGIKPLPMPMPAVIMSR